MPIDKDLLELLACPESRAPLVELEDGQGNCWLVSTDAATRRRYRVVGGIPNLLIDESDVLEPDAWRAAMAAAGQPTA